MKSKLTNAEETVMQIIWRLERCTVRDILEDLGHPQPPHSTISSIVRILEQKGYLDHKAYGRTYEYFPIITKEQYSKRSIRDLVSDYFEGSMNQLVSFLVQEKDLNVEELSQLIEDMEQQKNKRND